MWGLFPPRHTTCRWLVSLPPGVLVVLGVRGWALLVCAGSLPVAACWVLDPWANSGLCLGSDMSRGLRSLGPWLDLLGRRQLPAGPVGSSLQLPGASALWPLAGFHGTLPCSSLRGLQ
ncbi:hypothetical protein ILYODFUR_014919 [Ilyodon furcidens]|uniref:Uncharacterized protein n=1 Tax=Ilyodon furcidens TaxID=33524 RepID=A0ABV0SX48_9TELE